MPVIDNNEKIELEKIPSIYYLIRVYWDKIWALLDSRSEVNIINLDYAQKLCFYIQKPSIEVQKIDGFVLVTFKIVIVNSQIEDKLGRPRFFQKFFLVTNINFAVILKILFLKISNVNMLFNKKTLI